ncbi:MAG: ice-binding family protein, partial [Minicystis sp.]
ATVGTGTSFTGNILALTSITLTTGATVAGRALARNGAVTLDQNQVTASGCDSNENQCSGSADGASCDDGNACTQSDTCQAGTCTGANPVVCTISGNCTLAGTCAPATGVCSPCTEGGGMSNGEPHLTTFDRLLYDFQATGDFVLVNAGPAVVVQARQVLTNAFPNNPNTAMNAAAAAKLGTDRLAVFARPLQILVNGVPTTLTSTPRELPGGAVVSQEGTRITLSRAGSSVRFTLASLFVDVRVFLAPSVANVTGMLGNRDGIPGNDLITRSGQHLALPISFNDLYNVFGASWVVPAGESLFGSALLLASGHPNTYVVPSSAVTSAQFPATALQLAQTVCTEAAITDPDLYEACVLDVAATADPTAAEVFTQMAPPAMVVRFADSAGHPNAAPAVDPEDAPTACSTTPGSRPGSLGWWMLAAALGASRLRRRARRAD